MRATEVQQSQPVERTPDQIIGRYQASHRWRLYEKEWLYRNYPPAGHTWLDFGCGTGEITTQLALLGATRVIGIDVFPELLDMTRRRAALDGVSDRVDLFCGDVSALEPQQVDVVLCYAVLHHLTDRLPEVLSALLRWLKPGGVLLIVEPVCYLQWMEWLRQRSGIAYGALDPGERKLTRQEIRHLQDRFLYCDQAHFHLFARLSRIWPTADRMFRRLDRVTLSVPGMWRFAGTAVLAGEVKSGIPADQ